MEFQGGLYGHRRYFEAHGKPQAIEDFTRHQFASVTTDVYSLPNDWLRAHVPPENMVFVSNDRSSVYQAVTDALALGCLPAHVANNHPEVEPILAPIPDCASTCWVVTHVDMHHSPKVQTFLECLKEEGLMGRSELDVEPDLLAAT